MRRAPFLLTVLVGLALALAACGGSESPAGGEPPDSNQVTPSGGGGGQDARSIVACNLVTRADAEALLGAPAPEPERTPAGPFQTCAYYKSLTNFVQFQVCRCLSGNAFDRVVKEGADFLEVEAKPVSGIGDKAYWLDGILWVQKGDIAMNVWVSLPQFFEADGEALEGAQLERVALPVARDIALKALSRLN
jgi:hypothetical protein